MSGLPKNFMGKGRQVAIGAVGAKKASNTTPGTGAGVEAIKKPNSSAVKAKMLKRGGKVKGY